MTPPPLAPAMLEPPRDAAGLVDLAAIEGFLEALGARQRVAFAYRTRLDREVRPVDVPVTRLLAVWRRARVLVTGIEPDPATITPAGTCEGFAVTLVDGAPVLVRKVVSGAVAWNLLHLDQVRPRTVPARWLERRRPGRPGLD
jgi:hypothetical protein